MAGKTSGWRQRCRPIIAAALAALPPDSTRRDAERALHPLYPFGQREHHPYRMWRAECRDQLDAWLGRQAGCPDVTLEVGGPFCRFCAAKENAGMHECILCGPAKDRWKQLPAALRGEWGGVARSAVAGDEASVRAAEDWAEEHMGLTTTVRPKPGRKG